MTIKKADSKGRVSLGRAFANQAVILQQLSETEIKVIKARVIPEHEAWLLENVDARNSVLRGLEQAQQRDFAKGPDLDADAALADAVGD